jgi:hypothetical protein
MLLAAPDSTLRASGTQTVVHISRNLLVHLPIVRSFMVWQIYQQYVLPYSRSKVIATSQP